MKPDRAVSGGSKTSSTTVRFSVGWCAQKKKAPLEGGSSSVTLHVYLPNVDAAFERATSAGAQVKMPLQDQFWGDRYGVVSDPFGHKWSLATHVKDLSPEQMKSAMSEAMGKMPSPHAERKTA